MCAYLGSCDNRMETCPSHVAQFGRERKHNALGFPSNVDQAGQLACSLCSESFMDAGTLYEHVLNNHNFPQSKPLKCSLCRKRVPDYLQHLRVHLKEQHAAGPSCPSPVALDWEMYCTRMDQDGVAVMHGPALLEPGSLNVRSQGCPPGTRETGSKGELPDTPSGKNAAVSGGSGKDSIASPCSSVSSSKPSSKDVEAVSPVSTPRPPVEVDSDALREQFVQQLLLDALE